MNEDSAEKPAEVTSVAPADEVNGPRRPRLSPAMANVRRAVREELTTRAAATNPFIETEDHEHTSEVKTVKSHPLLLVALSGGADSLALAAAAAFEGPRAGWRAGAVVIDHGLQRGSAEVAQRAAAQASQLGLDPVVVKTVSVAAGADAGGPEAAARTARYDALKSVASETSASLVLLGHTLDDQAETVLLGLARGSGAASLSGMAKRSGIYVRPLLSIRRVETRAACQGIGLTPWDDPQNDDTRFSRVRVRNRVLPMLEAELGPGITEALARTAELLREDDDAFTRQIEEVIEDICAPAEAGISVNASALAANPAALRQRIIRRVVASEFGVQLTRAQTMDVVRLVTEWHGQGPLELPEGVRAQRIRSLIVFTRISV